MEKLRGSLDDPWRVSTRFMENLKVTWGAQINKICLLHIYNFIGLFGLFKIKMKIKLITQYCILRRNRKAITIILV